MRPSVAAARSRSCGRWITARWLATMRSSSSPETSTALPCRERGDTAFYSPSRQVAHQPGRRGFLFSPGLRLAITFIIRAVIARLVGGGVVIALAATLILIATLRFRLGQLQDLALPTLNRRHRRPALYGVMCPGRRHSQRQQHQHL